MSIMSSMNLSIFSIWYTDFSLCFSFKLMWAETHTVMFCSFPLIFPTLCILSYSKSYSSLVITRSRITCFSNSFCKLLVVLFFLTGIPETIKQFLREYGWSQSISQLRLATSLHKCELVFAATVNVDSDSLLFLLVCRLCLKFCYF